MPTRRPDDAMRATPTRILLIEADDGDARGVRRAIEQAQAAGTALAGAEVVVADRLAEAVERLAAEPFDIVLLDLRLPDAQGLQTFAKLYAQAPDTPIIVLADPSDELLALKAVQHGAQDYLLKGQVYASLVERATRHAIQRKTTEEALAEERERLAVTLRSIGDGVITTDTRGRVVLVNPVAERLSGWSQAQAAGRPLAEVFRTIDERNRAPCESPVAGVLATGEAVELDHAVLVARDGTERTIEESAAPMHDRDASLLGAVLVFRDVTERRRMQQELNRAGKLESIGILAGGIAHDFNNLLTAIIGYLSLARLQSGEAPIRELLGAGEKAALRARELTNQLLTFARGGAPVRRPCPVRTLVEDAVRAAAGDAAVRHEVAVPDDAWPVEADPGQAGQVFGHLLANAHQALPDGGTIRITGENVTVGQELTADCAPLAPGRYVRLSVRDDGVGIPAEELGKIFDPYFTTRSGANGLGLAICYSIVRNHEGHITAESEPGAGTTVHVYLPAVAGPQPVPTPAAGTAARARERRILVMDDDPMVREVLARMLERLGYETIGTADGAEAIRAYSDALDAGRSFAAVIMDLNVPDGMGGKEAIQRLRTLDPDVCAIVSSGYFNDPVMARHGDYGFDGVIAKPYQLRELRAMLERVVPAEG